jgi:hypothetical protein
MCDAGSGEVRSDLVGGAINLEEIRPVHANCNRPDLFYGSMHAVIHPLKTASTSFLRTIWDET